MSGYRIVCAVVLGCCLAGCSAKASKEDVLKQRLAMKGSIEGRTYKAPDRSFKVAIHRDAQDWLGQNSPTRPKDLVVPGDRWLLDGTRAVDGARVDYVTFWSGGSALERWDGYDANHIEVRRLPNGEARVDFGEVIDTVVSDYAERYKKKFGERISTERLARGEVESEAQRFVHAAYSYKIKGTVIPNTLSRSYRAYTNICVFRPQPDVVAVSVGEIVAEGRDINEDERERRIARDGCDLEWLATLKINEPSS